jgi:hypothetical protein
VKKNSLYIYLARRDKKGIKVISGFSFDGKVYATRVEDIVSLGLNPKIADEIAREASQNRMEYELFAESAASFDELKSSLAKRGYSHLPLQQFTGYTNPTGINISSMVTRKSTMIRRGSDIRR